MTCAAGSAITTSSRKRSRTSASSTTRCCGRMAPRRDAQGRTHDPDTAGAAHLWGRVDCRGSQGSARSVDEARRSGAGRQGDRGGDLRGPGQAASAEPHPGPAGHPGRGGAAFAGAQAHAQLELRRAGTGGAGQSGVSRLHPGGRHQDARRQDQGRWGVAVGPAVVKQIHERIMQIARDYRVAEGRRMRVDTTVVETHIHYPTDSSLLGDGVRVLTRAMKKITGIAGAAGTQLRDRRRSVKWRGLEIARAARAKGRQSGEKLAQAYRRLLEATGRVVGQAKRFATEIGDGVKRAADTRRQVVLEGLRRELESMVPRVRQVMRQTNARVFAGDTHAENKIVSLFEPSTEVIRKSLPRRRPGARPASPPNSAKWSNCRRRRTRSSSPTKSTIGGPATRTCCLPRSKRIKQRWAARRTWWQRMPAYTRPRTRRPRKPRASSASAPPTAPPRALSANASKRSVGSATARNGGPAARVASAWSNDGMDLIAAGTRGMPVSSAGSASG